MTLSTNQGFTPQRNANDPSRRNALDDLQGLFIGEGEEVVGENCGSGLVGIYNHPHPYNLGAHFPLRW